MADEKITALDKAATLAKADTAMVQAIGALLALRTEGNDLAKVIDDLNSARLAVRAVAMRG